MALIAQSLTARDRPASHAAGDGGRRLLARLLPWMVVAVLGFAVQTMVLFALVHGADLHYLPAMALAVASAVVHNFLWHERWTWADRPARGAAHRFERLARFVALTGVVSIAGGVGMAAVFVGWLDLPLAIANVAGVATLGLVNLVTADRLAFTGARSPEPRPSAAARRSPETHARGSDADSHVQRRLAALTVRGRTH